MVFRKSARFVARNGYDLPETVLLRPMIYFVGFGDCLVVKVCLLRRP